MLPAVFLAPVVARAQTVTQVQIRSFKFEPDTVEIPVGSSVEWSNRDGAPHTATADDGSFDTGRLRRNASATVQFNQKGTFTYFCAIHPRMKGTVTVV